MARNEEEEDYILIAHHNVPFTTFAKRPRMNTGLLLLLLIGEKKNSRILTFLFIFTDNYEKRLLTLGRSRSHETCAGKTPSTTTTR